jgi:hypothetical protein
VEAALAAAIDAARGDEDVTSWIRRKCWEAIRRGERPSFADALESAPAPALSLHDTPREAPAPDTAGPEAKLKERKETVRW